MVISILIYIQIAISIILAIAIALQQSSSEAGGALGFSAGASFHSTRRGFEKFLFYLSIFCSILFAITALAIIILKSTI